MICESKLPTESFKDIVFFDYDQELVHLWKDKLASKISEVLYDEAKQQKPKKKADMDEEALKV